MQSGELGLGDYSELLPLTFWTSASVCVCVSEGAPTLLVGCSWQIENYPAIIHMLINTFIKGSEDAITKLKISMFDSETD